jgi:ferredoxin
MNLSVEQPGGVRVELDSTRCTGLGVCEAMAPSHFEVQDDGSLSVLKPTASPDELAEVRAAVQSCPVEALRLADS